MRISFCTTCADRLYQFRQTFDANVEVIARSPETEWVILNYNSRDELHDFMLERLPGLPCRILYARDLSGRQWHGSVAKNVAHRLASGDVLFSLDCDNYIGNAVGITKEHFSRGARALHAWSGVSRDGTYGRVALERQLFYALAGYDESFYPMGFHETDLMNRATASGVSVVSVRSGPEVAIPNTKEDAIQNCGRPGLDWSAFNWRNKNKSARNIAAKRLVANEGRNWGELHAELSNGKIAA